MNATRIAEEIRMELIDPADNGMAVCAARRLAAQIGFEETDQCLIATAVSELSTNILHYAIRGEVILRGIQAFGREGFEVVARDSGPGIADIPKAMEDHYSSGNTLGLGLPSVKRIMDEFTIESEPGRGTLCVARKWRK